MMKASPIPAAGPPGSDRKHDHPVFFTPEAAAERLGITVRALRERLRRAQRRVGKEIVAELGVCRGRKFGRSWRLEFT